VIRAKIEAVLIGVAVIVSALVILTMMLSPTAGPIAVVTIAASVVSATMNQLWLRVQAKRSNFHCRQTSSRAATVAEALSSILWVGVAGLWIAGTMRTILVIALIGILLFLT
jgi:ABC-2 type transport system permease protein